MIVHLAKSLKLFILAMSLDLNDAAMSGNVEEVRIRLRMGEDPDQKFYPRSELIQLACSAAHRHRQLLAALSVLQLSSCLEWSTRGNTKQNTIK